MIFDYWYNKGIEAGYNKRAMENSEAHNKQLQDMLKYGKELGKKDGIAEGYTMGYKVGYSEGEQDAYARIGEIDIDSVMEEVADEYTGFHGLVNERGFVDDVTTALEEVTA